MITLDAEKIRDFQTCELLYKYRHVDKKMEPLTHRELLLDRFEDELTKILSFFFYKKQGGNIPSYNALLNRWQRSWFKDDTTAYDIAITKHEPHVVNETNLTTRAANVLLNFYNDFAENPSDPILINEPMTISVSKSVRLSGTYDVALRSLKNNDIFILKWVTRSKGAWSGAIDYGLDFAIIDYLFQHKSSMSKIHKPIYATYEIGAKNNKIKKYNLTDRDRNALAHWIDIIGNKEIFAPRRGLTVACKGCPFDRPCLTFNEYASE